MGWLLVCFDLPVGTKKQRRQAARFRKDLLDLGYFMMQFSVYVRTCVSYEKTAQHIERVKRIAPEAGSVTILFLTDRQWQKSVTIQFTGYKNSPRSIDPGGEVPQQLTFW